MSTPARNWWVTRGDVLAAWVADLSPRRGDPETLLVWLRRVLEAGERHEVYRVLQAPLVGYQREADGPLADYLEERHTQSGTLDVFGFANSGTAPVQGERLRVVARMAYAARDGRIVERDVEDLGALLRALRPADTDRSPALAVDCPPIDVTGARLESSAPARPLRVRLALRSDIWFPWVAGLLSERSHPGRHYDNRPLARRHTPRLNAFLAAARRATLDAGGHWELDEEQRFALPGMLTPDGIDLEVDAEAW